MYFRSNISISDWFSKTLTTHITRISKPSAVLGLEFVPWFSIAGFVTVVTFCISFGFVLSYFLTREIMDYDVVLTTQFVESVNNVESDSVRLGLRANLGQVLDSRTDLSKLGISQQQAADARSQFFDHIRALPDLLMANVYTSDRVVAWSTNPSMIGKMAGDVGELDQVLTKHAVLANNYFDAGNNKAEQHFVAESGKPYFESYIPLLDSSGEVDAVVQIYKQPQSLMQAIHHGKQLIWTSILLGALFLYLAPFWIFRRADVAIKDQQQRLCEAQTLCVIGEMSASVAHSIRNPLASIRSSAELALDANPTDARKNAEDIIGQVDRLGKWIRELLVFSRPVTAESQAVNLVSLVDDCLPNYATQLHQNRIEAEFVRPAQSLPMVAGNQALVRQALASVVGNAIEAMPNGGKLRFEFDVSLRGKHIDLLVMDTGAGMTANQIELAFKPFYTTKHNGVGLGMALVKRIMERFNGAILLHSQPGKGTQACLRFSIV